jgi:hypothetical protein
MQLSQEMGRREEQEAEERKDEVDCFIFVCAVHGGHRVFEVIGAIATACCGLLNKLDSPSF